MRLNNEETFICGKFCVRIVARLQKMAPALCVLGFSRSKSRWLSNVPFTMWGGPFLSVDNGGLFPLMVWSISGKHCGLLNRRG